MRHRPLLVVTAGLAGLLAVAPVFAAESTTPPPQPGASASSSSSTTGPAGPTTTTTAADPEADAEDSKPSSGPGASSPGSGPGSSNPSTGPGASDPSADPDSEEPDPAAEGDESDPAAEGDEAATSQACAAPETQEIPAPEPGTTETFDAGPAGIVEVERMSATDLRIVSATPNDGWTEKIATPSGPRVKGKFTNDTAPEQIVKFAASLNSDGSMLRTKVTDCG